MKTLEPNTVITPEILAAHIDHTKLTFTPQENTPDVQEAAIRQLCAEAREHRFFAVCVRPPYISLCKSALSGTSVKIATVIGFPQGKTTLADERAYPTVGDVPLQHKLAEVAQSVRDGADELDLVMNVHQFKRDLADGSAETLVEFMAVQQAAGGAHVKVIIETDLLTSQEIEQAAWWCAEAGVSMVKTSTGMIDGGEGGTVDAVTHIQRALADYQARHPETTTLDIKASGGIKTYEHASELLRRGVSRLGTSSGVSLMKAAKSAG